MIFSKASSRWIKPGATLITDGHASYPGLSGDVIVVYKVDRLTRSLADFAKLVEPFVDAEGEVLEVLVQSKRNKHAALKLMRKLLKSAKIGRVADVERCSHLGPSAPSLTIRGERCVGQCEPGRTGVASVRLEHLLQLFLIVPESC